MDFFKNKTRQIPVAGKTHVPASPRRERRRSKPQEPVGAERMEVLPCCHYHGEPWGREEEGRGTRESTLKINSARIVRCQTRAGEPISQEPPESAQPGSTILPIHTISTSRLDETPKECTNAVPRSLEEKRHRLVQHLTLLLYSTANCFISIFQSVTSLHSFKQLGMIWGVLVAMFRFTIPKNHTPKNLTTLQYLA